MGQVAQLIKARRAEKGLSQTELAELLGLQDGKSYISRIEAGAIIPSLVRLNALESALAFAAGELQSAALSDHARRESA